MEAVASDPARENAVIDRAQRLEAIQRMVSQTGNSEVLGTLSAELQHELANSDEPLNSVQARLQSLSNSGVTELDKAQYAALKADSALASPVQTSRLVGSQASAAVGGNPVATYGDDLIGGAGEYPAVSQRRDCGRWAGVGWGPDIGFPSNSCLGPGSNYDLS